MASLHARASGLDWGAMHLEKGLLQSRRLDPDYFCSATAGLGKHHFHCLLCTPPPGLGVKILSPHVPRMRESSDRGSQMLGPNFGTAAMAMSPGLHRQPPKVHRTPSSSTNSCEVLVVCNSPYHAFLPSPCKNFLDNASLDVSAVGLSRRAYSVVNMRSGGRSRPQYSSGEETSIDQSTFSHPNSSSFQSK